MISHKFEPVMYFSIPVPDDVKNKGKKFTLEDCMKGTKFNLIKIIFRIYQRRRIR